MLKPLKFLVFPLIVISFHFSHALTSPFPSKVKGLDIPNSHVLLFDKYKSPLVLRGSAPRHRGDFIDLFQAGIQKVIIFKIQKDKEVDKELNNLKTLGYTTENVIHIPFPWKNIKEFTPACQMLMKALKIIKSSVKNKEKLFFHCTVGEDRTGTLAGLFRIHFNNWSTHKAFYVEMCENGFAAGNPKKPFEVIQKIRKSLTPLYLKMAYIIKRKGLDIKACDQDPIHDHSYIKSWKNRPGNFTCSPSSKKLLPDPNSI